MTERLHSGDFDRLTERIWHLGQVSMRHLFEIAPIPSFIKGELEHGSICLEPEFLLDRPYPELIKAQQLPREVGIAISETAPYSYDENFTIYSVRKVMLNTKRRTKAFEQSTVMLDGSGQTITPLSNIQTQGERHRLGTIEWRELQTRASQFGKRDVEVFIDTIDAMTYKLYQDNLGI